MVITGRMFPTVLNVNDESVSGGYHWGMQAAEMGIFGQNTNCLQLPFQK